MVDWKEQETQRDWQKGFQSLLALVKHGVLLSCKALLSLVAAVVLLTQRPQ